MTLLTCKHLPPLNTYPSSHFSAPIPFTPKRRVTSIFDSLPLPHSFSEYVYIGEKSGDSLSFCE